MSTENERRREHAELEAEFQRLDTALGVLSDMLDGAVESSRAKDWTGIAFERSRIAQTDAIKQVHAEQRAVWDRLLDYRHGPEVAAQIRARVAERDADPRRAQRPGRSR
ncbi:hypothetical protein [Nocardia asiatica]|uniref:hypothetical protein n=1 Tax=Nocardia asiatica TaxID=209252 RepID=UPI003EE4169B